MGRWIDKPYRVVRVYESAGALTNICRVWNSLENIFLKVFFLKASAIAAFPTSSAAVYLPAFPFGFDHKR